MDYKMATVATDWWIGQMKIRCKELYPSKVIENDSNLVIVDESLQTELSHFREVLFTEILFHVRFRAYLSLTCFYWPSGDLGRLVRKTSISKDYFPPRANMQIHDGCVEISLNGEDLHKLSVPTTSCM